MRVIRRSLAPSISPYTNIPRGQRRSRFLQNMLHDLAFFQIPQNNAVYFFFNIPNLPIMTGQKITVFVIMLQISKGIQISFQHTEICLLCSNNRDNCSHELISHKHKLLLRLVQTALSESMSP